MVKNNKFLKVKISLLIIVSVLFLNTNTFGQGSESSDYQGSVTFGLTHSFHFTTITGQFPSLNLGNRQTSISTAAPRFTFSIGMTADYYVSSKFSVQFDFLYTYIGAHLVSKTFLYNEVGVIENREYYTYAMDYFKFPLTLNYYPMPKLYVNGGGYFATLISSSKYNHWFDSREPIDNIKPFDYGLVVGFGFNTKYAKFGFQYSYGFNNFIDNPKYNLHHNVFELTVRWKFYSDLRKKGL